MSVIHGGRVIRSWWYLNKLAQLLHATNCLAEAELP